MILRELVVALGLELEGEGFQKAEEALEALHHGANGLVAAFSAVAVGIATATGFVAHAAHHIDNLSQSYGIGTEELQRWSYAAGLAGLSADDMGLAISQLAKKGTKDINGELLRLADQMQKMPNDGRRVAFALEHLGRQGKALIPVLSQGREKLEELFAEAPMLDEETLKAGAELAHAMERIQGAIKKVTYAIGSPLLKPVGELAEGFLRWFHANEKVIKSGITEFVLRFWNVLKAVAQILIPVFEGLNAIAQVLGGWGNVLGAATAAFVAFGVAANLPLAGLVGLMLILEDLYVFVHGGRSVFGELIGAFGEAWSKMLNPTDDWKRSGVGMFFAWLARMVEDAIVLIERLTHLGDKGKRTEELTSGERASEADASVRTRAFMDQYGITAQSASAQGYDPSAFVRATPGTQVGKIEINVSGAGDPKAVAEAVHDKLTDHLESTRELYK